MPTEVRKCHSVLPAPLRSVKPRIKVNAVGYRKNMLNARIKGIEYKYPYFAYLFLRLDFAITITPKTPHHSTGAETNEILLSLPVAPSPYFSL